MIQTTAPLTFTDDGFDAFLQSRRDPDWLVDLRRAAWRTFNDLDWPDRRSEEWMRTDYRLFHLDDFQLGVEWPEASFPATVLDHGVDLVGQCRSRNGVPGGYHLDPEISDQGVLFGSLSELAIEHPDIVQRNLLTKAVDPGYDRFAALHAAFWSSGTLLYVPRGVVIDKPLHIVGAMNDGACDMSHTLVVLEEGAQATLLAEVTSPQPDASGFHCGATELILGQGSLLRYVNLQDWGQGVWHFAHHKAVLARDAALQWTIGALGSRMAKVNQHVALAGDGARCQVNGVMFTENKQHLSYHTLQHHQKPHCSSDFLYKAALQDQSRTVWRGMIKVDEDAQRTDGYQRNDNLLLSTKSRADSIPGLEIEADDVRCTHGSTSGRVDDELIFYAQSRGLTRKEAIRAIVVGFFQQIFDRITIESVRDALGGAISRRIREYE